MGKVEWEVGGWEDGWDRIVSGINASQEHQTTPRSRSSLCEISSTYVILVIYICNFTAVSTVNHQRQFNESFQFNRMTVKYARETGTTSYMYR